MKYLFLILAIIALSGCATDDLSSFRQSDSQLPVQRVIIVNRPAYEPYEPRPIQQMPYLGEPVFIGIHH